MQKSIDIFIYNVVYYNQKEGRKSKTIKQKERGKCNDYGRKKS